jgi:hypothetical protein
VTLRARARRLHQTPNLSFKIPLLFLMFLLLSKCILLSLE